MFDHLDDVTPVEPSDELRDSVQRRAAQIRRRRAFVPGAALVIIAALAILGIANVANDTTAPEQVIASGFGKNGERVRLSAQWFKRTVQVRVENGTDADRRGRLEVCTNASGSSDNGAASLNLRSCTETTIEVRKQSTTQRDVGVNFASTTGSVVVSWRDLSADPVTVGKVTLPIEIVSAETLTARLEVDHDVVRVGGKFTGNVVIDNHSGRSVVLWENANKLRCSPKWVVVVASTSRSVMFTRTKDCGSKPLTVPPGTTRLPFTAVPGLPPLKAGNYELRFSSLWPIPNFTPPAPVAVRVVQNPGPPCAPRGSVGDYQADVRHPQRAPLIEVKTFAGGVRWALCGASIAFSSEVLNLRSRDGGMHWRVTDTPIEFSPHHGGDELHVTFTDARHARIRIVRLVGQRKDTYATADGGMTWTLVDRLHL